MKPLTTPSGGTFTSQDDAMKPEIETTKGPKYSQGVWSIEHGELANKGQIFIVADEIGNHHKQCVARIGYAYDKSGNDLREGNAALLRAAPTLLKACKEELEAIATWFKCADVPDDIKQGLQISRTKIQNAINTATQPATKGQE